LSVKNEDKTFEIGRLRKSESDPDGSKILKFRVSQI
jgi:hypothetical protein